MTDQPSIIEVVDRDDVHHWASRAAQWVVDGLADGSLREADATPAPQAGQETTDAPVSASGEDLDSGTTDDGPAVGEPGPGSGDDGVDDGVDGATTRRRAGRSG